MPYKIGRYEIIREIGRGGLGTVYLATDPALGRSVAVKVLSLPSADDYVAKRFQREAYSSAKLTHPGVVPVYDVGTEGDVAYIVMQFISGGDLNGLMKKSGELSAASAAKIIGEVADALDYAHGQGVVHRDVKPSNILIGEDGAARLSDFGVARIVMSERTTQTNTVVGTFGYMAPEQFGNRATAASDQYSLGVVAHEIHLGRRPFAEENVAHLMHSIITKRFQPGPMPEALRKVFSKVFQKNPEDRYPSCKEFASAFRDAVMAGRAPAAAASTVAAPSLPMTPPGADPGQATGSTPPSGLPQPQSAGITQMFRMDRPTGFEVPNQTRFFQADKIRFDKIEESIRFYRDNLDRDYMALSRQADITYKLWVGCVALGFLLLIAGIVIAYTKGLAEGLLTSVGAVIVYFVQKLFQQREDHYRLSADEKSRHLQYGNQWLLVIQSIDAIEDGQERARQQARLVKVLTAKLGQGGLSTSTASTGAG